MRALRGVVPCCFLLVVIGCGDEIPSPMIGDGEGSVNVEQGGSLKHGFGTLKTTLDGADAYNFTLEFRSNGPNFRCSGRGVYSGKVTEKLDRGNVEKTTVRASDVQCVGHRPDNLNTIGAEVPECTIAFPKLDIVYAILDGAGGFSQFNYIDGVSQPIAWPGCSAVVASAGPVTLSRRGDDGIGLK